MISSKASAQPSSTRTAIRPGGRIRIEGVTAEIVGPSLPLRRRTGIEISRLKEANMASIGFIGLGNMGAPMAANLVKSGRHVLGFDVVPASLAASARDGVQIVANARATVENADIVITMLPAGEHVLSVWNEIVLADDAQQMLSRTHFAHRKPTRSRCGPARGLRVRCRAVRRYEAGMLSLARISSRPGTCSRREPWKPWK